ncbi:FIST signal transduction protein [Actinoallomurus rhizosphaericola]|uniref:FIST signal transduction protein n=1 Tax=Actinoallomurus rhizosphaericola TaxID=2952536 RepID=UPI0020916D43|nr:FIST N-terminal domain-containing protein [Actinoallomurus rhizosphaericola]MCO5992752.1 FIST C-terminal domain-containing protein [Actinoallomurus rhizosphaericola]
MARFGDGLAVGPDLVTAAESAVAQAVAPLDGPPDLVFVFVSASSPEAVEPAARRAMEVAGTPNVIGCGASGVIGGNHGVEGGSAVSAWAARLPEARIEPFRLETLKFPASEGEATPRLAVVGMPQTRDDDVVAVLLADPYSFPVDAFVERSGEVLPGLPLVGGLATGQGGRGTTRLFADGEIVDSGAVGVLLGGSVMTSTVVSQGARPIGPTMVVTKAEDNVLYELAGMPALAKLEEIVAGLPEDERGLVEAGLLIGVAMDEYAERQERGDFLVRGVIGADPEVGALAAGEVIEVGRTVRFHVRDADAADEDLSHLLGDLDLAPIEGALLFSCTGRGRAMFPSSDHDVRTLRQVLGGPGVGGFFAAGEIGPVAGRNHVHSFTASILAFGPGGKEGPA